MKNFVLCYFILTIIPTIPSCIEGSFGVWTFLVIAQYKWRQPKVIHKLCQEIVGQTCSYDLPLRFPGRKGKGCSKNNNFSTCERYLAVYYKISYNKFLWFLFFNIHCKLECVSISHKCSVNEHDDVHCNAILHLTIQNKISLWHNN